MLHFGITAVLLGREIMVQMPSFFLSAVPMFLQVLGGTGAKDLPNLLQPGWVTRGRGICIPLLLPWWEPPAFEQSL